MKPKKIFIISALQLFAERLCRFLRESNYEADYSVTLDDALNALAENNYDLIFCDVPILTNSDPFAILKAIQEKSAQSSVVFITEKIELKTAIALIKAGVYTCVNRPVHTEELLSIVEEFANSKPKDNTEKNTVSTDKKSKDGDRAIHKAGLPSYVEGRSSVSKELYNNIEIVSNTALNVIVYGETGTGKESVARRLAGKKGKYSENFIAIDCGCLSKELAASELFGHVKGAFTGALQSRAGAFELAKNGTIFLDEIGNLDYQVQTYLLRAIQERKIRRIGSEKEIDIDVRIIVACNELLSDLVKKGQFREDLYHRLNEFEIVIPPLRNRRDDIPLFIDFFLKKSAAEFDKDIKNFSKEAIQTLQDYPWPGNIRELKNAVRKMALLHQSDSTTIEVDELPDEIRYYNTEDDDFADLAHLLQQVEERELGIASNPPNLKEHTMNAELAEIVKVLRSVNFNKTKAAEILQINRKTLYNKLKLIEKYGLQNIGYTP